MLGSTTDDDVFAVMAGFLAGIHDAAIGIDAGYKRKIAHSTGSGSGIGRKMDVFGYDTFQTGNYVCFQMSCHIS